MKITAQAAGVGAASTQTTATFGVINFGQNASAGSIGPTGATGPTGASGAGGIVFTKQGTTSAGASFTTTRGDYAKKITIASACLIPSIVAFVKGDGTNYMGFTALIYSDSSGPTNMLAISGPGTDVGNAHVSALAKFNTTVRELTLPIGYVAAAGDIWIVLHIEDNSGAISSLAFNSGTGADYTRAVPGNAPLDSSLSAFSSGSNDYCIYANVAR